MDAADTAPPHRAQGSVTTGGAGGCCTISAADDLPIEDIEQIVEGTAGTSVVAPHHGSACDG